VTNHPDDQISRGYKMDRRLMTVPLAVSLVLVAVGATLVWGVESSVAGLDLAVIGVIGIVVGISGIILALVLSVRNNADDGRAARRDYMVGR
jgi:ABC-type Fe3+ transport system permease subunit